MSLSGKKELSLYFHIPFCTKKCPYCHFYVVPDKQEFKDKLLKALKTEWERWALELSGKNIVSIYFGGGTPLLFGPKAIETILSWISPSASAEITLEANPENVTKELMQAFKHTGINRVSLGVQSLDDSSLAILGRTHASKTAKNAILHTYEAGIENISIDLMYDLPHQTVDMFEKTLSQVKTLPITHLSLYNLTIEPHTVFFKHKDSLKKHLPSEEHSLKMLECAVSYLEEAGLKRYEISAFAKEGYESIHNTGYWLARPFLGFGPSAFSYWNKKRFRNIASLNKYADLLENGKSPIDFEEELSYPNDLFELFAVAMRLFKGVDLEEFQSTHGKLPQSFFINLEKTKQKGWVEQEGSLVKLSKLGHLFYDSFAEEII